MFLALTGSYTASKGLGRQMCYVACSAYSQRHDGTCAVIHSLGRSAQSIEHDDVHALADCCVCMVKAASAEVNAVNSKLLHVQSISKMT